MFVERVVTMRGVVSKCPDRMHHVRYRAGDYAPCLQIGYPLI